MLKILIVTQLNGYLWVFCKQICHYIPACEIELNSKQDYNIDYETHFMTAVVW